MKQLFSPLKIGRGQTRLNKGDDGRRTTDRPSSVVRGRSSHSPSPKPAAGERGQSIVLIAAAMVGLIALAGLAIDVGFVFVRGAQLQAAVDAAALAGVIELKSVDPKENEAAANNKAKQFMQTNEMPDDVVGSLTSEVQRTELGQALYFVKASWNVELFFLRVIGRDTITITREAEAAYFPLADIYASRYVEDGRVSSSNQSVFGPNACTYQGDPFSPFNSKQSLPKPRNPDNNTYSYTYRVLVPKSYWQKHSEIEIQIFDPDTFNPEVEPSYTITHTNVAQIPGGKPQTESLSCDGIMKQLWNTCLIDTKELTVITDTITVEQINPYWFVRVDEYRKNRGGNTCTIPQTGEDPRTEATETEFELYYYSEANDGTVQRNHLSTYVGKNNNNDNTDLRWVTPGLGLPGHPAVKDPGDKPFKLNINAINGRPAGDVPGILVDSSTEDIYIYLDVTAVSGASENGFEFWAGPSVDHATVPSNVNERNLYILNNPGKHHSDGAIVFAVGSMPMNSNFGLSNDQVEKRQIPDTPSYVDIPLVYLDAKQAASTVTIRLFDTDSGAIPPITFYIDTISEEDWSYTFGAPGTADPQNPRCFEWEKIFPPESELGVPGSCGDKWTEYEIDLPGGQEGCDWSNPATLPPRCTPFYGGRLVARYRGGFTDSFGWWITVDGLPYLTK